jgi:acetyl esterase/lipase
VTSGPALTGTKEAVFAAATSYYGVSDLRPFATDTHDFESRYLDGLIGPLPEADALYTERAPVGHVTELTCPILLLQGLDDPIVPPSQSEAIAADLAAHGIRYAYIAFAGESHGFRKAETVTAAWRRNWPSTARSSASPRPVSRRCRSPDPAAYPGGRPAARDGVALRDYPQIITQGDAADIGRRAELDLLP